MRRAAAALRQAAADRGCLPAQIYPRLYVSGSMYEGRWWQGLVTGWEWVVSSPLAVLLPCALVGMLAWRLCGARWRKRWQRRKERVSTRGRDLSV